MESDHLSLVSHQGFSESNTKHFGLIRTNFRAPFLISSLFNRLNTFLNSSYLEIWGYNDFASWYLQYNGLSLKKPQVPLRVIDHKSPGEQFHQQCVQSRFPLGQLHLHRTVPLGKRLQRRPVRAEEL